MVYCKSWSPLPDHVLAFMPCNHPISPDGSRRRFLCQLGAGFGTLAMEALLRQEARAAASRQRPVIDPLHPFAPRTPHLRRGPSR